MRHQIRIQNPVTIDQQFIEQNLNDCKNVIVQFSEQLYNDKILDELNELCLRYDENFTVRFYGHYSKSFDCKTVDKMANGKSVGLDCLTKAIDVETITQLKHLKRLSLGIFELKETEILNAENLRNLDELIIAETKTKALNLEYLKKYKNLSYLIVSGHTKNIDAIGGLTELNFLSLKSISKAPITFINQLQKLKTLKIILGGRENIDEIKASEIEHLELIWIRGFNA